jgi:hypothetical protein
VSAVAELFHRVTMEILLTVSTVGVCRRKTAHGSTSLTTGSARPSSCTTSLPLSLNRREAESLDCILNLLIFDQLKYRSLSLALSRIDLSSRAAHRVLTRCARHRVRRIGF